VATWHLHCPESLGKGYGEAIRESTREWLP